MKMLTRTSSVLAIALAAAQTVDAQRLAYPAARTTDQVDVYHGTRVADPYRWLEDTDSPETRAWIEAENAISERYLASIPERTRIHDRLTQLWNFARTSTPARRGGRYFFFRNSGLQNQSVLYVADSLRGQPRVVLDPNTLRADGTEALSSSDLTDDGRMWPRAGATGRNCGCATWTRAATCRTACAGSSSRGWRGPGTGAASSTRATPSRRGTH